MSTSTNTLYTLGFDLTVSQKDLESKTFYADLKKSLYERVKEEHIENTVEMWQLIPFPKGVFENGDVLLEIQAYFNIN